MTTRIERIELDELTGRSDTPQPAKLPRNPNAPALPTDPYTLHARLTRTFTELRWLRHSPPCAGFFFLTEREALDDARAVAAALVRALEAV